MQTNIINELKRAYEEWCWSLSVDEIRNKNLMDQICKIEKLIWKLKHNLKHA